MTMTNASPAPISEVVRSLPEAEAGKLKHLLERGVKIPAQPRVLEELRKLVSRKEFDIRLLSRVINQDAGITAMLFKACTNASYRQHQPFNTVEEILQAVGVRQTYNLVQAISLVGTTQGKGKSRLAYETFWARSQAIAQLAMLVADERIAVCNIFPDQAFLAGLFHDCGVALLMQRFSNYCTEMNFGVSGQWAVLAEEDRKFNADHSVVGYLVARHWGLPDFICDAVRNHHDINGIGSHASRSMVAILQVAIEIYCRLQHVENAEWSISQEAVFEELGLGEEGFPEFVDIVIERFHQNAE